MLQEFLSAKPLYYDKIDYSRMPRIYESIKEYLPKPKIIHLIGTNGKGTTGRFLATSLYSLGFQVGHYTSPHILNFNERVWLNGLEACDATLETAHKKLQTILTASDAQELSYFEYTTLLGMLVFQECDYVVMEAGLGGEHDATAVFDKILTLVTPIAFDHEAFLGNSIKEIATTKLNAIQNNAIVAEQKEHEVYDIANSLAFSKSLNIKKYSQLLNESDELKIDKIATSLQLHNYLIHNLALSISALKFLKLDYSEDDFIDAKLFGRLTHIRKNIIIDVGHNPLAAEAIKDALINEKYILVYNSYKDKEYKKILQILKPIIKHIEILSIDDSRIESQKYLENTLNNLDIKYTSFKETSQDEQYLVFGSFSVVETFLKIQNMDR